MSKHHRHKHENNSQAAEPAKKQIEELAYSFYEADGRQDGHALEHWLRAKEQLSEGDKI